MWRSNHDPRTTVAQRLGEEGRRKNSPSACSAVQWCSRTGRKTRDRLRVRVRVRSPTRRARSSIPRQAGGKYIVINPRLVVSCQSATSGLLPSLERDSLTSWFGLGLGAWAVAAGLDSSSRIVIVTGTAAEPSVGVRQTLMLSWVALLLGRPGCPGLVGAVPLAGGAGAGMVAGCGTLSGGS